jgi:regulator of sigma E protease
LGGFVRPKGENDPNVEGGLAAAAPWKRLFVLFAGPFMNLATALMLIAVIISQMGGIITRFGEDAGVQNILITEVVPNSPAEQAGLLMGDVLVASGGERLVDAGVLESVINANVDSPTTFVVLREGNELEVSVTPRMNEQEGRPMIGIGFCAGCEFQSITTLPQIMQYSLQVTGTQIYALVTLPVRLIQGTIPAEQGRLVGLKGIFDIMERSVSNDVEVARTNTASPAVSNPFNQPVQTLFILASLSISLGIFNLFPFPALDGGRIIFVLPELLFRRRVPHQFENLVHGLGMALLLLVMIYVNVRDFIDPVTNSFP